MDCNFQQENMSERTKKLKNLSMSGYTKVSKKDINLFKIDTFETSLDRSYMERLEKIIKIKTVTYSKNTGISLWVCYY